MEKRALVVDDYLVIRELLEAILEGDGWQVLSTRNGEEGLTLFDLGAFELVVAGLALPGMNGAELIQAVREGDPQCKTILTTGSDPEDPEIKARIEQAGADVFLPQPLTLQKVREAVTEAFLKS